MDANLRSHLKRDCTRAKYQKVDLEASGEEEVAAREVGPTGSTIEVKPVAVTYEDVSPVTSIEDCTSPKAKRRK